MIEYKHGDILKEDAEALVNTINCVGVMGRGIALQFKNAFPDNFKAYATACGKEEVQPGRMFVFGTGQLTNPRYIINFPTKRHWRGKSRMEDIEAGLKALVDTIRQYNIRSIAIPPLGSGLGGLDWSLVKPCIEGHLVSGYSDGGDAPNKHLNIVPGAIEDAITFLQQYPDTRTRLDKVAQLVEGFESPFGLELLSTVHWVMKNESVNSVVEVINHTYAWNDRKRQFTPRQIALAAQVLADKGWVREFQSG